MTEERKFTGSTLLVSAVLVGFVGFAAGFNYPAIERGVMSYIGQTETQNEQLPQDLDYESVESVYDILRRQYDGELSQQQLLNGLKGGLAEATGDPYTTYLDQEETEEFRKGLKGTFSGIGAEVAIKNDRLVVVAPLAGSPASKAGLQPGDFIAEIEGESTADLSLNEAVNRIRGQAGSEVTLTIIRGNNLPKEVKITRSKIEVPSVSSEVKKGNIGYIELNRFGPNTKGALKQAAQSLLDAGADKFVLDLRNNPGGLLDASVDVADVFLGDKLVVEQRRGEQVEKSLGASEGGLLEGKPLVVLINGGSASASEIVAGALKDHGVATIVGEQSFGKGSVQELVDLRGQTALKVTVARWYTPQGKSISEEGITPDVKVKLTEKDFNNNRDPQLAKALELLQEE